MVAAVFAVTGLLLGGRAVHISLTEDEDYRAFADEQAGGTTPVAAPTRGSIVSADGRELATSLEVARVIATPYQIEDPGATARELHAELSKETDIDREADKDLSHEAWCGRPAQWIQRRRHGRRAEDSGRGCRPWV